VAVSVRQDSGNYWDGAGFNSATEVLLPAAGTGIWTLDFPATNFPADDSYTVRAVATDRAGNTTSTSRTFTFDRTAPTVVVTFPADGGAYNNTNWNNGCTSTICGTASDTGSGVTSVAVSVRQGSGNYWDGTGFNSATEVLLPATGTASWTLDFPATNFPAEGSYTVRAVAPDGAGNSGSATATVIIDRTAPTVGATHPAIGGSYGSSSWDAGCSTPEGDICGTAADAGSGVDRVAISLRRGTTSGLYWDGTGFNSTAEVSLLVDGTTSWSFPFPASNFPGDGTYRMRTQAVDNAGNLSTILTRDFAIDVTAPAPTGLTLFDGNGTVSPATDEVRITFSEPLNVSSVCSAWSGTGDQALTGSGVVVTITDNGSNDILTVTSSACTLRVGSIATGRNYVIATSTFSGLSLLDLDSRVTWTASTRLLTIRIGNLASGLLNPFAQSAATVTYTPNAGITDVAGNPIVATPFSSSGQRF
jgi:hypothetical protein